MRKHIKYLRYDTEAARVAMNAVYADLRLLQNLFLPSVKLQSKERVGTQLRRRYGPPQAPLDRVQACPRADRAKVQTLVALRTRLNPFVLATHIEEKLERVYRLTAPRSAQPMTPKKNEQTGAKTAPACSPPSRKIKTPRPSVTLFMARRSTVG